MIIDDRPIKVYEIVMAAGILKERVRYTLHEELSAR